MACNDEYQLVLTLTIVIDEVTMALLRYKKPVRSSGPSWNAVYVNPIPRNCTGELEAHIDFRECLHNNIWQQATLQIIPEVFIPSVKGILVHLFPVL